MNEPTLEDMLAPLTGVDPRFIYCLMSVLVAYTKGIVSEEGVNNFFETMSGGVMSLKKSGLTVDEFIAECATLGTMIVMGSGRTPSYDTNHFTIKYDA